MSNDVVIPKGYIVTYGTYSGDMNEFEEQRHEGLSENKVKAIVQFVKHFDLHSDYTDVDFDDFDLDHLMSEQIQIVDDIISNFVPINKDDKNELKQHVWEGLCDYLGYSENDYLKWASNDINIIYNPQSYTMKNETERFVNVRK
jgi:hypothetical protein